MYIYNMYYFCSFIQVKKTKKFNIKNKIDTKTNQKTFNRYFNCSSFSCICWASILSVAIGLASNLFKPIGFPVTSQ